MAASSDRIIKLVFIRVDGTESARKAVVPLVEGCDFDQFMARVRRRIGLSSTATVRLNDITGPVDSIDRLLEVDEGNTLLVDAAGALSIMPAAAYSTPSSAVRGGPAHRSRMSEAGTGGSAVPDSGSAPECRVDVPTSEWASREHEDETGAGKYRKRERPGAQTLHSLALSARLILLLSHCSMVRHRVSRPDRGAESQSNLGDSGGSGCDSWHGENAQLAQLQATKFNAGGLRWADCNPQRLALRNGGRLQRTHRLSRARDMIGCHERHMFRYDTAVCAVTV